MVPRYHTPPPPPQTAMDVGSHSPQSTHASARLGGGLITLRHNILADDWGDLCGKALTPSAVSDEPRIHTGRLLTGRGEGARRAREEATNEATQARIARGEDPAEDGQHNHTDGAPGDDN